MKHGVRIKGKTISLILSKHEERKIKSDVAPRFSFIVPASVDKRATARNRTKRLLSEAVRLSIVHITPDVDCVVIASRNFKESGIDGTKTLIHSILMEAKLFK